jgi:hypothetical protein
MSGDDVPPIDFDQWLLLLTLLSISLSDQILSAGKPAKK